MSAEKTEFCKCEEVKGIFTKIVESGYWDCCDVCDKPIEEGFHYDDDPVLY